MTQASAADRRSVREAQKVAAEAERSRGEVLVQLMSTTPGRAWVWERLEAASMFATTYNDNPQRMAFQEGCRNAGLQLLNDLMQFCPDLFIQAMREANGRRSESAARDATAAERSSGEDSGRNPEGPGSDSPGPEVDDTTGEVRYN